MSPFHTQTTLTTFTTFTNYENLCNLNKHYNLITNTTTLTNMTILTILTIFRIRGYKNIYVLFQLWPGLGEVRGCGPGYDGCRNVTIPTVGGARGRRETHTVCSAAADSGALQCVVITAVILMLNK